MAWGDHAPDRRRAVGPRDQPAREVACRAAGAARHRRAPGGIRPRARPGERLGQGKEDDVASLYLVSTGAYPSRLSKAGRVSSLDRDKGVTVVAENAGRDEGRD